MLSPKRIDQLRLLALSGPGPIQGGVYACRCSLLLCSLADMIQEGLLEPLGLPRDPAALLQILTRLGYWSSTANPVIYRYEICITSVGNWPLTKRCFRHSHMLQAYTADIEELAAAAIAKPPIDVPYLNPPLVFPLAFVCLIAVVICQSVAAGAPLVHRRRRQRAGGGRRHLVPGAGKWHSPCKPATPAGASCLPAWAGSSPCCRPWEVRSSCLRARPASMHEGRHGASFVPPALSPHPSVTDLYGRSELPHAADSHFGCLLADNGVWSYDAKASTNLFCSSEYAPSSFLLPDDTSRRRRACLGLPYCKHCR